MHVFRKLQPGLNGLAIWLTLLATTLTAGEIELRGVDGGGDALYLSLKNTKTGATGWVAIGERFSGYKLKSYDPQRHAAQLEREGETITVTLAAATIAAPAPLSEEQREEIKKKVLNNLRQLAAAADQYYLEHGVSQTKLELLVGKAPDRYIRELKTVDGEDYSKLVFKQGVALRVKTVRGVEVEYQN